ncbi:MULTISPECIES: hypothetical protein [Lactococcus]|uniref:hypothetical protein n=1 Tax=Lactococcus TaxID=1357 RepID=UPI001F10E8A2|nr:MULTISPECIES: hypothetical protein [Lactococcus]MBS5601503.1 hypothetical protein [Lactococcus lactis]MCH5429791.1 hypothetical protein [Lactococcus lactis]MCT1181453.1 hypothetical protein [Lactococcus lactis]MCT4405741.1 hypothetical protein [Lactococcus cremoris]MDM7498847.1 hypothetical protein [Lactococcus lactis]
MNLKKTYFMKTFNLIFNLILFSILDFIILASINIIIESLMQYNVDFLMDLIHFLISTSNFLLLLGIISTSTIVILTAIEVTSRIRSDYISNFFQSTKQTFSLRRFMGQSEKSEKIVDTQKVTAHNPINDKFNRSVRKCYIDVMDDKIIVFIKVPRTQQTQKILKELESQIKEEISSQNPEYIFSNFERHHNQLWLQGTKRK